MLYFKSQTFVLYPLFIIVNYKLFIRNIYVYISNIVDLYREEILHFMNLATSFPTFFPFQIEPLKGLFEKSEETANTGER